jgi:hypothetical protein
MLQICQKFGNNHGLNFNSKKTVCINFHLDGYCDSITEYPEIKLNGENLVWCKSAKHLGVTLSCCSNTNIDINVKKGKFIGCVNDIATEFAFAHPFVKQRLLNIYGTSFYGSPLWNLYDSSAKSLYTTWNIAVRKMHGLPYRTHTRFLDHISGTKHISIQLKLRFIRFIQKLLLSCNVHIQNLVHVVLYDNMSPTGRNLSRIMSEFNLCSPMLFDFLNEDAYSCVLNAYTIKTYLPSDEMSICSVIKELLDCTNGTHDNVLSYEESNELLSMLCTC